MSFKDGSMKNYLGRNNEIEGLRGIAAEAQSGDASSVLVYGKRGVGKTELLKQLYSVLFNHQRDAVPFFYTIKTPFASLEEFSRDYLSSFVLQSLAFLNKDLSLAHTGIYSFDDLIYIAHKSEAKWAVEIIDRYLQLKEEGNTLKMFSHAITAPHISYMSTGRAVIVLLDDFHKIRKFCELNLEGGRSSLWVLLENSVTSRHTPHIIAGSESELQKMFFEETSLGNSCELINLKTLAAHESLLLFKLLGQTHKVAIDMELPGPINVLCGNPFYIKSFMQAARQSCNGMSEDDFWQIYLGEVVKGKIYTYWTSLLKSYVPQFELRKPSLQFLFSLNSRDTHPDFAALSEQLSIKTEDLDRIINMLQASGTIETGFSTFGIADDEVLIDVIKAMYYSEVEHQSLSRVKEMIMESKSQSPTLDMTSSFDLSIPSTPKAELVALKSLEQAAQFYHIPVGETGRLQLALVELFNGVLAKPQSPADRYSLKFFAKDNIFSVTIVAAQLDPGMMEKECDHIRSYVDDLKIEGIMNGTKITMSKEIKEDILSAS